MMQDCVHPQNHKYHRHVQGHVQGFSEFDVPWIIGELEKVVK